MLRSLIREMVIREDNTNPFFPDRVASRIPTTANIPSYHQELIPNAQSGASSIASLFTAVSGYVVLVSNGKIIAEHGTIKPDSALAAVGGVDAIKKFCLSLEPKLRASIVEGSWIYSAPDKWKANVLKLVDPSNKKPYFSSDIQIQNLAEFEKSEIQVMPIMFMIADPLASTKARDAIAKSIGVSPLIYAWYNYSMGSYNFNLITDFGWKTIKPAVEVNKQSGKAPLSTKQRIVSQLKTLFSNPGAIEHVAKHEYVHGEEKIYEHFILNMLVNRSDKGMDPSKSAVSVLDPRNPDPSTVQIMNNLRISRLAGLRAAISQYSSDLINAKTQDEVATAILKRRPTLAKDPNWKSGYDYLAFLAAYSRILFNLNLIVNRNHPMYAIGGDFDNLHQYMARTAGYGGNQVYSIGGAQTSDPQSMSSRIKQILFAGNGNFFELEHLIDTVKMIQQYSNPNNVQIDSAIAVMDQNEVSAEESRRARVLLDLTGQTGLKKTVEQFAAADQPKDQTSRTA